VSQNDSSGQAVFLGQLVEERAICSQLVFVAEAFFFHRARIVSVLAIAAPALVREV
jgi:hypothetical protein